MESIVLQVLSTRCSVQLCRAGEENGLQKDGWDLVVLQDAVYCLLQTNFCHKLKKYPWLFVSTRPDIRGYMAPTADLFGVANFSGINLSLWGIPEELQLRLDYPVERAADWYFYEQQPEVCRIAYCPTGNSVQENDFKLLSFIQKTNAEVTIVSDRYRGSGCIPSVRPCRTGERPSCRLQKIPFGCRFRAGHCPCLGCLQALRCLGGLRFGRMGDTCQL
ncbi:hypothetical protein NXV05_07855 [Parabacteroides johnsonii]|nr:hypothetical protein [Parabacteroides johnsonii]